MIPPFEMKPFREMTKKEATLHFNWYLDEIPKRIELIRMAYLETSNRKKEDLDLSPQSLIKLWEWFLPLMEIITKSDKEITEELKKVPNWLNDEIIENNKELSSGTLSIAMDIAIYFAEVFIRNFEKLEWGLITKPKSLAYVNSPVVVGFSSNMELDPRNLIYILTLKAIDGHTNKEDLYNLFEIWKGDV